MWFVPTSRASSSLCRGSTKIGADMPGAERPGLLQRRPAAQASRPRRRAQRRSSSTSSSCSRKTSAAARSSKKARSAPSLSRSTVMPAAMAWPPPLTSRPSVDRVAHQPAEVEAGDRAAGAGADAVGVEGDGEGRTARSVPSAARPAGRRCPDASSWLAVTRIAGPEPPASSASASASPRPASAAPSPGAPG